MGFLQKQIIGGPSWLDSARFDIEATAEANGSNVTIEQMELKLQSLLEDRFQLRVHVEERELPVYNMIVEKSGLKMKLSTEQNVADNEPVNPAKPPKGRPWLDGEC